MNRLFKVQAVVLAMVPAMVLVHSVPTYGEDVEFVVVPPPPKPPVQARPVRRSSNSPVGKFVATLEYENLGNVQYIPKNITRNLGDLRTGSMYLNFLYTLNAALRSDEEGGRPTSTTVSRRFTRRITTYPLGNVAPDSSPPSEEIATWTRQGIRFYGDSVDEVKVMVNTFISWHKEMEAAYRAGLKKENDRLAGEIEQVAKDLPAKEAEFKKLGESAGEEDTKTLDTARDELRNKLRLERIEEVKTKARQESLEAFLLGKSKRIGQQLSGDEVMRVRAELATSLVIEDVNLAGIRATMVQIDKEIANIKDALTARERHTELYEAIKKLKKGVRNGQESIEKNAEELSLPGYFRLTDSAVRIEEHQP